MKGKKVGQKEEPREKRKVERKVELKEERKEERKVLQKVNKRELQASQGICYKKECQPKTFANSRGCRVKKWKALDKQQAPSQSDIFQQTECLF